MKNLIIIIFVLSASICAQGWNNAIQTTISGVSKQKSFTNKDGIHIVTQTSQSINYYLVSTGGSVIRNSTIENGGSFPNITGDNNQIYLLYKISDLIKIKYSSDAGANWVDCPSINTSGNACNGIDAIFQPNIGVHIVWATQDDDPYYESHYYRLDSEGQLTDYKNVTDYTSNEVGGYPTVSSSSNKVHVSFNAGYQTLNAPNIAPSKYREKNLTNNTWSATETVNNQSCCEKVYYHDDQIYLFFFKLSGGMGQYGFDLMYKSRSVAGGNWTEYGPMYQYWVLPSELLGICTTVDNGLHILFGDGYDLIYRKFDGSSWENPITISGDNTYNNPPSMSAVTDDLYLTWQGYNLTYLTLRQYDTNPSAPENLALTNSSGHPYLQWTKSKDPDVNSYKVYRKYGGSAWAYLATTSNLYYYDQTVSITPRGGEVGVDVYYKIIAKDISNYESGYSNSVSCNVQGDEIEKEGNFAEKEITSYGINHNYPNPFNPSTLISYRLPQSGKVTLKVYDPVGNEVATLVNQEQSAGRHEVSFDAGHLSSGVYICRIIAGDFVKTIKMSLVK